MYRKAQGPESKYTDYKESGIKIQSGQSECC